MSWSTVHVLHPGADRRCLPWRDPYEERVLLIPKLEGALNTGTLDRPTIFFGGAADFFC